MKTLFLSSAPPARRGVHWEFAETVGTSIKIIPLAGLLTLAKKWFVLRYIYPLICFVYGLFLNIQEEVVLVNGGSAIWVAIILKMKNPNLKVVYLDGDQFIGRLKNTLLKKIVFGRIDAIISVSEGNKKTAKKYFNGPIEVVNPYPREVTYQKLKRENYGLYVGRLDPDKNIDRIIRFAVQCPYFEKMIVVGSGALVSWVEKISRKNEKIVYVGWKANPSGYYSQCKFMTHLTTFDSFPLTTMEAAKCGCYPIISEDIGTSGIFNEIFKIRDLDDFEEINQKIEWILKNEAKAKELLKNSLKMTPSKEESLKNFKNKFDKLTKRRTTKIAVFHNYIDNIGGAEIVCLTLARGLGADLYTTNIDPEKIKKMGFSDVLPKIFSIGKIPLNAPFKQQFALRKFRRLNLGRKYDFYIIGGDWAISGAVKNKPNLWYVHSPIREIWDLYKYTRQINVPWFLRWIFDFWVLYNQYLNKKYVNKTNAIVCNSRNVRDRLKKYLNKDAIVINPPIETSKFYCKEPKNYWLSVNRLISHKRIDLQLKAFSKLPDEKLVIVGSYEQSRHFKKYANYCQRIKPENVEIRSWVPQNELRELYAGCKGFITTSQNEDFGMNVVEAMASGKPVIAPDEGGYKETIINGITGILIDDINDEKLINAIKTLGEKIKNDPLFFKESCQQRAKGFDSELFIEKIKKIIEENA